MLIIRKMKILMSFTVIKGLKLMARVNAVNEIVNVEVKPLQDISEVSTDDNVNLITYYSC